MDINRKKNSRTIAFMITSMGWGGLEMNVLKIAKSLRQLGYNITLATQEKSPIYINSKNLFDEVIILHKTRKYFEFRLAYDISKALKNKDIQTLLVFDNKDLDVLAWTKKIFFKELKVIYQQQMQIGPNKQDFIHDFRFKAINYWISPLQYLKNEVLEKTNYYSERIKVIPLCTEIEKYVDRKYSKLEARQVLNIFPKAPLIGIIGRITRKKGQLFLLEALIELKNRGIEMELLIFGSATVNDHVSENYYELMLKFVKKHEIEGIVHFVKYQEDVTVFYNAIDVFALASHSETFGMVTIEAMLSKLPIIATKSGGTSEILGYGKYGLLYEYENHEDFCQNIFWLLNNHVTIEKMSYDAQKVASESYTLEREVKEVDKLLNTLILEG
tara:strand:+ start:760 stop:1917 length:1158 start_codon:yes stop_codon:yes gene_type:complete